MVEINPTTTRRSRHCRECGNPVCARVLCNGEIQKLIAVEGTNAPLDSLLRGNDDSRDYVVIHTVVISVKTEIQCAQECFAMEKYRS